MLTETFFYDKVYDMYKNAPVKINKIFYKIITALLLLPLLIGLNLYLLKHIPQLSRKVEAVQMLTNPSFTGGISGWSTIGVVTYDASVYQDSAGSVRSTIAPNTSDSGMLKQTMSTPIVKNSTTTLSFYWRSTTGGFCGGGTLREIFITLEGPDGPVNVATINITTNTTSWYSFSQDISSLIANYQMTDFTIEMSQNNKCTGNSNIWIDNIVLDATPPPNQAPTAPTGLLTNDLTNPTGITTLTPYFSAIFNDPDTGDVAPHFQIQVNTNNTFTGTTMWDSGKTLLISSIPNGTRSPDFDYPVLATQLSYGATYYWRIRFWDAGGAVGPYSATAQFTIDAVPYEPSSLQTNSLTNPTEVTSLTPNFSAIFSDPDSSDTGNYYQIQVNTDSTFTGGTMWDSGKTAVTPISNNSRSPNITYAGSTLYLEGSTYYWRIRFWDDKGVVGPYNSTPATFTMASPPKFTDFSATSPVNPEDQVTFTATASDTNNITLVVCKTPGVTGTACDGGDTDTFCTSTPTLSNPSCTYTVPVSPAGTVYVYPYVFDATNLAAGSTLQGSTQSFTISNVAPTVTNITLNNGNPITLETNTTKAVTITADIVDGNGCGDISSVYSYTYRSDIGYTGCDISTKANGSYCYPEIECTAVAGTCEPLPDKTAKYTCTVNLKHYAEPTDANTQYPTENWLTSVKATDSGSASYRADVTTGVEVNSLNAFTITKPLEYGELFPGDIINPLSKITTISSAGNTGLDHYISGTDMTCTDNVPCSNSPLPVTAQKYSLSASTAYTSGTTLTTTPVLNPTHLAKQTTDTATTRNIWWGVEIPLGIKPGGYYGLNTITAEKSNIAYW